MSRRRRLDVNEGLGVALDLARERDARSARVSSWDQRGRNQDGWTIGPGESRAIADLEGPGSIRHFFITGYCRRQLGPGLIDPIESAGAAPVLEIHNALGLNWEIPDPDYYRKVLLRITYDDQSEPAVLVPLGDFFGIGHSMPVSYSSALFSVSAKPDESFLFGGSAAMNCTLPMPFSERVLVELVNENDIPYAAYFHVDYELYRHPLDPEIRFLHAAWRRQDPCDGWGTDLQVNSPEANVPNLSGDGNYVVLDTEGSGHYVGCNLSVFHRDGTWWGEGDDMIFIDDDTWPPSFHGTGTEDYFGHAWGMQRGNASPFHGSILHEADMPGYAVTYRQHVPDPIHFRKRIRVTIEHGHANQLSDDWASTAYWYQTLPSPRASILPVERRLPHRPVISPRVPPVAPPAEIAAEVASQRQHYQDRQQRYLQRLAERTADRAARSRAFEQSNRESARALRQSYR
jgi:hypothetical protein